MSAALTTVTFVGIAGLAYSAILGFTAATADDVFLHTSLGIFSTLLTLLAHSMTMFYLIGKGKAVREAAAEGELAPDYYATVARVRRPVFSIATLAMALTMATAIFGGGVDTGVIPPIVHSTLAVSAIVGNVAALRTEVVAMVSCARVVAEVDQLLEGRE